MRVCFCLMLVVFVSGESMAMAQGVAGGVKVGVTFATLSHDSSDDVDLERRTGFVGGGYLSWYAGEHLELQLEGLYTQKGAVFDQMGVTGTTKLDYVELPVLLVYSTAARRSGGVSGQLFAGPSVAFKVSTKGSGSFQGESVDVDIPDEAIRRADFGVVVGAGLAVGAFTIDGRYTVGLTNINSDDRDATTVRNRALSVLAGVRF